MSTESRLWVTLYEQTQVGFANGNKDLTPQSGLLPHVFIVEQNLLGIQKGLAYLLARRGQEVHSRVLWCRCG